MQSTAAERNGDLAGCAFSDSRECAAKYEALVADLAPSFTTIFDSFKTAFLPDDRSFADADEPNESSEAGQFLDVGCGPGSFTLNHLLPRLPAGLKRLVAVDNLDSMLEFAKKNSHEKIEYRKLNIVSEKDVAEFVNTEGNFRMVCSFMTLHVISDHHRAMKNIATLMAPGGECFILFYQNHVMCEIFAAMTNSTRWRGYSDVLRGLIPPTRKMETASSMRSHLLSIVGAAGLTALACEVHCTPGGMGRCTDRAIDFYTYGNPLYNLAKEDEKLELRKFIREIVENLERSSSRVLRQRNMLVIHAYKSDK